MVLDAFRVGVCDVFWNAEFYEKSKNDFMSFASSVSKRSSGGGEFYGLVRSGRHQATPDQPRHCPVCGYVRDPKVSSQFRHPTYAVL